MLPPILLVEDHAYDVELTMYALGKCEIQNEIIQLGNGETALDYLLRYGQYAGRAPINPALMLLDVDLPGISGIDVVRGMRSLASLDDVPVVIFTASDEEKHLPQLSPLGIEKYVVKPLDYEKFVKAVCDAVHEFLGQK